MLPLSCVNCSFNGLQYESIGTSFGYCVEHRVVLRHPESLTCGRHFRKDLPLPLVKAEHKKHVRMFSPAEIVFLRPNGTSPKDAGFVDENTAALQADKVTEAVSDYGQLDSKKESLAVLRSLPGTFAEVARLLLSRTYVNRCVSNGGAWTSGIHLFWYTRKRLLEEPEIEVNEIRFEAPIPLARQIVLAKWSVLMLRILFLSDMGHHAAKRGHKLQTLRDLPDKAAEATGTVSFSKLFGWLRSEARHMVDAALPEMEYHERARRLHRRR